MKATSLIRRVTAVAASAAAMTLTTVLAPTAAHAAGAQHYYIEIGGTGATLPAPRCTSSYDAVNSQLPAGSYVPVCYPATAGPFIGTGGLHLDSITAPSFDSSVQQGYQNALKVAEDTYHAHPNARLTITGYSQGGQVADEVLQTIANGTDIPSSQVDGMLYADPMQRDTGIWAEIPKGLSALGFTSPGAGPVNFGSIPVERFCIHTDGVCDATSPMGIVGYFQLHPTYPANVIPQSLAQDGGNGIIWK
ncbi:PE-PPE domain-containing protein [Kitasatospora sp. GP82]|uniref:PE-PPE domain-containing protein n=1 Tax=Kitasatospora sp. GP82 TaxID=3035089 RepID=UPI0024743EA6|nr:PE-PPE domain-containing protein [Kitasatospora sp. GP82]MDH6124843.1 hypothetical protein [Kitasatospora sp. GP82]